jgi:hypothetical protein
MAGEFDGSSRQQVDSIHDEQASLLSEGSGSVERYFTYPEEIALGELRRPPFPIFDHDRVPDLHRLYSGQRARVQLEKIDGDALRG